MNNRKATKRALLTSVMALALCVVMLVGTTFAWFTDTAKTSVNKIEAGKLKIELQYATEWNEDGSVKTWSDAKDQTLQFKTADGRTENIYWEPGCTYELPELRVVNMGNLALKFYVSVNGVDGDSELLDVIDWKMTSPLYDGLYFTGLDASVTKLLPGASWPFNISAHMQKDAGNHYQGMTIEGIGITVVATQATVEKDSKDDQYDKNATYPVINADGLKSALAAGGIVNVAADIDANTENTEEARMTIAQPTTLNLDKKIDSSNTVLQEPYKNFSTLFVEADTTINAGADGGITTAQDGRYGINVKNGATLIINGGTYDCGGTAVQVQEGTLIINGGIFSCKPFTDGTYGSDFLINCIDSAYKNGTAKVEITGGTFVNFDPSADPEGAGTSYVDDGYKVISETKTNGDIWYTVIPA